MAVMAKYRRDSYGVATYAISVDNKLHASIEIHTDTAEGTVSILKYFIDFSTDIGSFNCHKIFTIHYNGKAILSNGLPSHLWTCSPKHRMSTVLDLELPSLEDLI